MALTYSKKVMEHFLHPHNVGEITNPDAVGQTGNPICGDIMRIYIKVKNNRITNIKFKTLGCAAAIAASSMLTDLAKGKTLEQAERIKSEDIVKGLGTLPMIKVHCSVLGAEALHDAIKNYRKKVKK
jgi:nitrogen fixation NifU-like protein